MAGRVRPATQEKYGLEVSALQSHAGEERQLSRSPHPYLRRGKTLLQAGVEGHQYQEPDKQYNRHPASTSSSESGTEADDERGRFLRALPAPPVRARKGLRDIPFEDPTPQPSPLHTPPASEIDDKQLSFQPRGKEGFRKLNGEVEREKYFKRKRSEVVRRITETVLFLTIGLLVGYRHSLQSGLLACGSGEADGTEFFLMKLISRSHCLSYRPCGFPLPALSCPNCIPCTTRWSQP